MDFIYVCFGTLPIQTGENKLPLDARRACSVCWCKQAPSTAAIQTEMAQLHFEDDDDDNDGSKRDEEMRRRRRKKRINNVTHLWFPVCVSMRLFALRKHIAWLASQQAYSIRYAAAAAVAANTSRKHTPETHRHRHARPPKPHR